MNGYIKFSIIIHGLCISHLIFCLSAQEIDRATAHLSPVAAIGIRKKLRIQHGLEEASSPGETHTINRPVSQSSSFDTTSPFDTMHANTPISRNSSFRSLAAFSPNSSNNTDETQIPILQLPQNIAKTKTLTPSQKAHQISESKIENLFNQHIKKTTHNNYILPGCTAVIVAATTQVPKVASLLAGQPKRIFGIDDAFAAHAIISMIPTALAVVAGSYGIYKLDRLIHAEDRNNYSNLRRDLAKETADRKTGDDLIHKEIAAKIAITTKNCEERLAALSARNEEQHKKLAGLLQRAQSSTEQANQTLSNIVPDIEKIKLINNQVKDQASAMMSFMKDIKIQCEAISALAFDHEFGIPGNSLGNLQSQLNDIAIPSDDQEGRSQKITLVAPANNKSSSTAKTVRKVVRKICGINV